MHDRFFVDIVELEGMTRRAVHQHRQRHRALPAHAHQRGNRLRTLSVHQRGDFPGPRQGRSEQAAAYAVQRAQLDALDRLARYVLIAQSGGKLREIARRIFKQRGL